MADALLAAQQRAMKRLAAAIGENRAPGFEQFADMSGIGAAMAERGKVDEHAAAWAREFTLFNIALVEAGRIEHEVLGRDASVVMVELMTVASQSLALLFSGLVDEAAMRTELPRQMAKHMEIGFLETLRRGAIAQGGDA